MAWIITTRFASRDTYRWMRALYNRLHAKDPTWKLAGFVVDEPSADIQAIRYALMSSSLKSVHVVGSTRVLIFVLPISNVCFYFYFFMLCVCVLFPCPQQG